MNKKSNKTVPTSVRRNVNIPSPILPGFGKNKSKDEYMDYINNYISQFEECSKIN